MTKEQIKKTSRHQNPYKVAVKVQMQSNQFQEELKRKKKNLKSAKQIKKIRVQD